MAVRDWSVIKSEIDNSLAAQKQADKDAKNKIYDTNKNTITNNYTQSIKEGEAEYEDDYRENAVQKKVNEFYIAEEMANMGLTNSGLNRTQITANQLSYANNKAEIDRKRQSMVDSLKREMNAKLTDVENERTETLAGIDSSYEQFATEKANEVYKTELEYDAAVKKANIEALQKAETKYKVRTAGGSGFDGQGNKIYYFYDENGEKHSYPAGINPYTGLPITGGYTAKEIEDYGGVWNGYQPKGVKYNDKNYGAVHKYQTEKGPVQIKHQGHYKTIWQTDDGSLWVWDDEIGNYARAYDDGKGNISYEFD